MTHYLSVLGLGFGDCGKGRFVDALCRQTGAHTVVRFNGGAQAGHNVVLDDGRHHTFSQFTAGSFDPQVHSVLSQAVVVHPSALLVEAQVLAGQGVAVPLQRLWIDARCRVTTPYHQAAGRLREWARGAQAHGTCGVGVGETVAQSLRDPAAALRYGDLRSRTVALEKLETLRTALCVQLEPWLASAGPQDAAAAQEVAVLRDPALGARWLRQIGPCLAVVPAAAPGTLARRLARPGTVLFEGAQGMLLDEWQGFHPHTTWSSVGTAAVERVLDELALGGERRHFGALRTYPTRHGAGPFPTHDPALDGLLPEPHNTAHGWQGRFRRGHPDAVLLDYALRTVGPLDGLLVSHLDALEALPGGLRWCTGYREPDAPAPLRRLPTAEAPDLAHQQALTARLARAVPCYDPCPVAGVGDWRERLRTVTALPVRWGSYGPRSGAVRRLDARTPDFPDP